MICRPFCILSSFAGAKTVAKPIFNFKIQIPEGGDIIAPFPLSSLIIFAGKSKDMRLITKNSSHVSRVPDIWCHGFARFLSHISRIF